MALVLVLVLDKRVVSDSDSDLEFPNPHLAGEDPVEVEVEVEVEVAVAVAVLAWVRVRVVVVLVVVDEPNPRREDPVGAGVVDLPYILIPPSLRMPIPMEWTSTVLWIRNTRRRRMAAICRRQTRMSETERSMGKRGEMQG
jgi:hypothetical protein